MALVVGLMLRTLWYVVAMVVCSGFGCARNGVLDSRYWTERLMLRWVRTVLMCLCSEVLADVALKWKPNEVCSLFGTMPLVLALVVTPEIRNAAGGKLVLFLL